jgi:hypothetical protein
MDETGRPVAAPPRHYLSGRLWVVVLALSLLAPTVVGLDKAIQLSRQRKAQPGQPVAGSEA